MDLGGLYISGFYPEPASIPASSSLWQGREDGLGVAGLWESRADKGTKSLYFLSEGVLKTGFLVGSVSIVPFPFRQVLFGGVRGQHPKASRNM